MGYLTEKINKLENGMEVLKLGKSVNTLGLKIWLALQLVAAKQEA